MTTKQKIKKYLEHGLFVVMKSRDYYRAISPVKIGGKYIASPPQANIEKTKESFDVEFDVEKINDNYQIVETYHLPYKPYEVGEKVEYDGVPCEIKELYSDGNYFIESLDDEYRFIDGVSHRELKPHFEEEDTSIEASDEELIAELEKRGRIIKGNIIE